MFGYLVSCMSASPLGFWEVLGAWLTGSSAVSGDGGLNWLEGWIWRWGGSEVCGVDSLGSRIRVGSTSGGGEVGSLKGSSWGGERVNSRFWGGGDSSLNSTFKSLKVMRGGERDRLWRTDGDIGSIWISGEGEWEKSSFGRGGWEGNK